VIIPNNVKSIDDHAFQNNKLTSVSISNSVTSIGEDAFKGNLLRSIIIPNSVTYIGRGAFYLTFLRKVIIPNSVTYIGEDAFDTGGLLDTVVSFSESPPLIFKSKVFGYSSSTNTIRLLIPPRTDSVYLDRGWRGFRISYIPTPTTSLSIVGLDTCFLGDSSQYVVTILPNTATDTSVNWSSLTPSIVSIDQSGLLQALRVGTGRITATQGALVDTFSVTVQVATSSISILGADTLQLGNSSHYTATIFPANATDTSFIWQSLTPNIVSIDQSGLLQALRAGTGKITATQGALVDTFTVAVQIPTDSISIFGIDTLQLGDSYQYTVDIFPTNATDTSITWYSITPGIVSIDSTSGLLQTLQATTGEIVVTQGSLADTLSIFIQDTISTSLFTLPEIPQNQVVLYNLQGKRIATMKESEWNRFRSSSIGQLYFVRVYSPEGAFLKSYKAVK
jgi:uncharacterized protein YjdB